MATTTRTIPPITAKELITLQEFVTIPAYLIKELPPDKLYALMDILSMADKSGEIKVSTPTLMKRWDWGNTKVRNFIDYMLEKEMCKQETNKPTNKKQTSRQTRVLLINTEFFALSQTKAQTRNKQADKQETNKPIVENLKMILNAWNELSEYGIGEISEIGLSSIRYQNLKIMAEKYGTDDVISTIQRIKISDFLQGKVANWKISFDWFIKDDNYQKVRSGKYNRGNIVNQQIKKKEASEQSEDEELIGDEWIDL